MKRIYLAMFSAIVLLPISPVISRAQQTTTTNAAATAVPHLMKFSGSVKDASGKGVTDLTFAFYKDQEGGAALWIETQNVQ